MLPHARNGVRPAAPQRQSPASVRAITAAVGCLLADYVGQLRDDLRFSDDTRDAVKLLNSREDDVVRVKKEKEEEEEDANLGGAPFGAAAAATTPAPTTGTPAADAETLDEAAPLTEADVAECRQRLQRMRRVHQLLVEFASTSTRQRTYGADGTAGGSALSSSDAGEQAAEVGAVDVSCDTVRCNPVLMLALRRFDSMVHRFQGTQTSSPAVAVSQPGAAPTASFEEDTRAIQPFLTPVPLPEGALSAFSRNVSVVFRKRPASSATPGAGTPSTTPSKRPREAATGAAPPSSSTAAEAANAWAALGAQQRKRRFALYTARTALLPRVDGVCAPLYVSPAVHELAQLNAEAERAMLVRAWCVHTKAHLLRELPSVARDVEAHQLALREALQSLPDSRRESLLADVSYIAVMHGDAGVVRVRVQNALVLDLTYDLRRRQWSLLALHWLLCTSSAAASLVATSLTSLGGSAAPSHDGNSPVHVVPQDREALHGFLQRAFVQGGLSEGLQAAGRLVCAVVMDTFATQMLALQQSFFTGAGLGRLLELEVRPGTFVSFRLAVPSLFTSAAPTAHVRARVAGGTVLLECVWGTDLATRHVTLPLGTAALVPASGEARDGAAAPRVVVDAEAFLWQCVASSSSVCG